MPEPGIAVRLEIGRVWEDRLYRFLRGHPAVAAVTRFPDGPYGIDFAVKPFGLAYRFFDAKSDIRRDTGNHSIQADLPFKYVEAYKDAALIAFDDYTAIPASAAAGSLHPGTRPGRTPYILLPKRRFLPIDYFLS